MKIRDDTEKSWKREGIVIESNSDKRQCVVQSEGNMLQRNRRHLKPILDHQQPFRERSDAHPIRERSDARRIRERSDARPIRERSDARPIRERSDAHPTRERSDARPIRERSNAHPIRERSDAQPFRERSDAHPFREWSDAHPQSPCRRSPPLPCSAGNNRVNDNPTPAPTLMSTTLVQNHILVRRLQVTIITLLAPGEW